MAAVYDALGVGYGLTRRPDPRIGARVRAGISLFAQAGEEVLAPGLRRLAEDLDNGRWQRRYGDLLALDSLDVGYRLLVADLPTG